LEEPVIEVEIEERFGWPSSEKDMARWRLGDAGKDVCLGGVACLLELWNGDWLKRGELLSGLVDAMVSIL
jgi:hypothetical protein